MLIKMLAVSKLFHRYSSKPTVTDLTVDALKDELQMERARVEDLMHEMNLLQMEFFEEIRCLKTKLATEKKMYSVLRSSFTMRTVEESWATPNLADFETDLKRTIKDLELKVLDLEAENYASEERSKTASAEAADLREKVVIC